MEKSTSGGLEGCRGIVEKRQHPSRGNWYTGKIKLNKNLRLKRGLGENSDRCFQQGTQGETDMAEKEKCGVTVFKTS